MRRDFFQIACKATLFPEINSSFLGGHFALDINSVPIEKVAY